MNLPFLFPDFCHLGVHPFPEHICTVSNAREPEVMDSSDDAYHVVILVDRRFPVCGRIAKMKPYTARDENGSILYGWVDAHGNFSDHGERYLHDDHQKVVAWKPCPADLDLRVR